MTPTLVVLSDFYAVSNQALSYASGLAVPLRGHLLLLHDRRSPLLAPQTPDDRHHATHGARHTAYALQELAAEQPVPTEVDISEDDLASAIREAVQHRHPLLLVLGRSTPATTPIDLVTDTIMGLLRAVPYPLLLVPGPGWNAFPPRRLLLALDGQPFVLRPHQDVLRRLLTATQGTLEVVHVGREGEPLAGPATLLGAVLANNLVDGLPASSLHLVQATTVPGGVLEEAARLNADMLVVVARPHSWLGGLFHASATARLLHESPIPVLVLPAEA